MSSLWELHGDLRHLLTNPREFADDTVPWGGLLIFRARRTGSESASSVTAGGFRISAPSPYS
jgi:hypothetical protein